MLLRYFTKKRVFTHFAPLLIDKHRVIRIILLFTAAQAA
ncbi:Uncharacterized protein YP598_2491 [Yersinia pseudotuberculosis]|nr:Uncharacterized protein YP598_2491 [Yersinia pseudotuberculosis]